MRIKAFELRNGQRFKFYDSDEKEYTAVGIVDGKLLYNDHNHFIKKDFFLSNLYITVSVSPYVKCTQLSLFS